jgi:hypothetical protein
VTHWGPASIFQRAPKLPTAGYLTVGMSYSSLNLMEILHLTMHMEQTLKAQISVNFGEEFGDDDHVWVFT